MKQELLGLALGAGVHDDPVALVGDALLGATLRVHLEVGDREGAVVVEDDLAEAERVAAALRAGVLGVDADGLGTVLDVDVDAVLAEAAGSVLESRVARQRDGRDVGVVLDGDGLELAGLLGVAAVGDGALAGGELLVLVGSADVDRGAVLVADERLEVVVLALGGPAVLGADGARGGLVEADRLTLLETDLAARRSRDRRSGAAAGVVILETVEETHRESFQ